MICAACFTPLRPAPIGGHYACTCDPPNTFRHLQGAYLTEHAPEAPHAQDATVESKWVMAIQPVRKGKFERSLALGARKPRCTTQRPAPGDEIAASTCPASIRQAPAGAPTCITCTTCINSPKLPLRGQLIEVSGKTCR